MKTVRYVYWQDGDMWLGYVEEFPDYVTQGETLAELQENLKDIYDTRRLAPASRFPATARSRSRSPTTSSGN